MEDCKKFSIVIPCFNRPSALKRLLNSLENSNITINIDIIFSIDYSGNSKVEDVATAFEWKHGNKKIIKHNSNIGLRNNIIFCGNLTKDYDAIIVLEEDLIVAYDFLNYSLQAYNFYLDQDEIAGISLYKYEYSEFSSHRFYPLNWGYDVCFIQWPSSRGQLWTKKQWESFYTWYIKNESNINEYNIPSAAKKWEKSWKKFYAAYIVDTNKYFVYPFYSFTNVLPTIGENVTSDDDIINTVSLFIGHKSNYNFQKWNHKIPMYDSFLEMDNLYISLNNKETRVDMNLYASKEINNLKYEYFITSNKIANAPILKSWAASHIPFELNIINDVKGDSFYLYSKEYFKKQSLKPYKKRNLRVLFTSKDCALFILHRIQMKIKSLFYCLF